MYLYGYQNDGLKFGDQPAANVNEDNHIMHIKIVHPMVPALCPMHGKNRYY